MSIDRSFLGTGCVITSYSIHYTKLYDCYIVSVGDYLTDIDPEKLKGGIEQLIKEQEPTMVVIPEAILLDTANCLNVQQAALLHCGDKMKSRFAILDVPAGYRYRQDPSGDCIDNFRNGLGINNLDFGAAYYPWVNTTIIQDRDLNYQNISNPEKLQELLRAELGLPAEKVEDTPAAVAQKIEALNNITSYNFV